MKLIHWQLREIEVFGKKRRFKKPIRFNAVVQDGSVWMSSTPQECMMMEAAAREMRGTCLVAGLGLGVFATYASPRCDHVIVVERDAAIAREIGPQIERGNIKVIHEDIYEYLKRPGLRFDSAYFDIWDACDPEHFPYVNYLVSTARDTLTEGKGVVRAWTYESMVKTCSKGILDILRAITPADVERRKKEVLPKTGGNYMFSVWPVVTTVLQWWAGLGGPRPDPTLRAYIERFFRRIYTEKPAVLFNLTDVRRGTVEVLNAEPFSFSEVMLGHSTDGKKGGA